MSSRNFYEVKKSHEVQAGSSSKLRGPLRALGLQFSKSVILKLCQQCDDHPESKLCRAADIIISSALEILPA